MNESSSDRNPDGDNGDEFRAIVTALDEAVPREQAWVQLTYGGDPYEGQIVGNCNGFRRLGVEFLTATLNDEASQGFHVDLEYLISPASTINFDCFEVSDTPLQPSSEYTWFDRLIPIGCLAVGAISVVVFSIGVYTVAQWAHRIIG